VAITVGRHGAWYSPDGVDKDRRVWVWLVPRSHGECGSATLKIGEDNMETSSGAVVSFGGETRE
jgi:hypothetical protein